MYYSHDRPDSPSRSSQGLYGISTAASLVGMGVQQLRQYESRGLIRPARTDGGTRRYSDNDLARLRRIGDLLSQGLNMAGIALVMELQDDNHQLRRSAPEMQSARNDHQA